MKLVEAYSTTTRLRIEKMHLTRHFFPLGIDEDYIVVVSSTGAPGKNYSHFKRVLSKLKPILAANNIKIVQVGGEKDERIGADVEYCGKTTQYQYFDIIANSLLVLSGDTSAVHVAGHYDNKIVALYSISSPEISDAYFGNKKNQTYLTPPGDYKPSFDPNENPKQIDKILPETVVAAVCAQLGLEVPKYQSLYIGSETDLPVIESVPNTIVRPDFHPNVVFTIRYDKGGDEEKVYEQLKHRKAAVVTKKRLDIKKLLAAKNNVGGIIYVLEDDHDPEFAKDLHRNGIPYRLVTFKDSEWLRPKKLSYVDYNLIERKEVGTKEGKGLGGTDLSKARFYTNKRVLSDNKSYLSFAHLEEDKVLDNFAQGEDNVIDSQSFWDDADFYYIFK